MLLDLRWRPMPWLAALATSVGLGQLPASLELAAVPLATRRLVFLALTLATPAASAACCALGLLGVELRVADRALTARVLLPRSSLGLGQAIGLLTLVGAVGLAIAMGGHLAADCLLGGDCPCG
jgi:hypothetical protein